MTDEMYRELERCTQILDEVRRGAQFDRLKDALVANKDIMGRIHVITEMAEELPDDGSGDGPLLETIAEWVVDVAHIVEKLRAH